MHACNLQNCLKRFLQIFHIYFPMLLTGSTNEMLIGFHESQRFQLWIRSQVTKLTAESSEANDDKLLGWRQHCFTWKADGQFRVSEAQQ